MTQMYCSNRSSMTSGANARTTAEATPERKNGTRGEIHGNRKSKIYHLLGCSGYGRTSPANRVLFGSEAEAVQAGYHKAKNCP